MQIKIVPLISFPIPFSEIKEAFPIDLGVSLSEKNIANFVKRKVEGSDSFDAVKFLTSLDKELKKIKAGSKKSKHKDSRYVIITEKQITYRGKPILGISEFGGNSIVSTFLIEKSNSTQIEEDIIKVILHEIGHGLDLGHCKVKSCIMNKLENIDDLEMQRTEFCNNCKKKLKQKFNLIFYPF